MSKKANFIKLTAWSSNGMRLDTAGGIIGGILIAIDILTPEQKARLLSRINVPNAPVDLTIIGDKIPPIGSSFEYTNRTSFMYYGPKARWYLATCIAHYEDKAVILTNNGGIYIRGTDEYMFRTPK